MKSYLLDTCTFLWLTLEPEKLSDHAATICKDPDNVLFLSAVSVWEIDLKHRLGRLELAGHDPKDFVPTERINHEIYELPFNEDAALQHGALPFHHKDPFDRMLICQAIEHGFTLLTPDPKIAAYTAPVAW